MLLWVLFERKKDVRSEPLRGFLTHIQRKKDEDEPAGSSSHHPNNMSFVGDEDEDQGWVRREGDRAYGGTSWFFLDLSFFLDVSEEPLRGSERIPFLSFCFFFLITLSSHHLHHPKRIVVCLMWVMKWKKEKVFVRNPLGGSSLIPKRKKDRDPYIGRERYLKSLFK